MSKRAFFGPIAVLLALGWRIETRAANAPDWTDAIVESMPAVTGVADYPWRTLLDTMHIAIDETGRRHMRYRVARQALSAHASDMNLPAFAIGSEVKVERSDAWHRFPDGKIRRVNQEMDLASDEVFVTDRMMRVVHVDDVEKGSLIFIEVEAVSDPVELNLQIPFFADGRLDLAHLELETPPAWDVRWEWLRGSGVPPVVEGTTHAWEVRDLDPVRDEPLGEAAVARAPILVVGITPPASVKAARLARPDWRSLAMWYEELAAGRDDATAPIAELARGIVADAGPGSVERSYALARYVRDRVRYVAKAIGIGGYRPHAAGEVLANLYGDCKDKVTLLNAMLETEGLRAWPVLVNAALSDTVSTSIPSVLAFNHMIIAVALPPGASVPPHFPRTQLDAGPLGSVLLMDVTDEYSAVGELPARLAGKMALIVAGEQSTMVTLPDGAATAHRVERRIDAEVRSDRSVDVVMATIAHGSPATEARATYRQSADKYRREAEKTTREIWSTARVSERSVEEESSDGAFRDTATIHVEAPAPNDRSADVAAFPGVLADLPRVSLSRRQSAVAYEHALSLYCVSTLRGLPADTPLPAPVSVAGTGWSARAEFSREGAEVKGTWELELSRLRFEPAEFEELRRFWAAAVRSSDARLPLPTVAMESADAKD